MPQPEVIAAGVVVRSKGAVLLVHRPAYDDWSFPKGKLDRGEHITTCAVREVREETGLDVRLGVPLTSQHYPVGRRDKVVHYWAGRVVGERDVSGYEPNKEIDQVRWVPLDEAAGLLTHARDRDTLAEARTLPAKTDVLVVLRHAAARSRKQWRQDDRLRPLLAVGTVAARRLAPVLAAYDVKQLVSSSSLRCLQTLAPYAEATGRAVGATDALTEQDATPESVLEVIGRIIEQQRRTVLCSHRPVLPDVFATLGVADPGLDPGELVVVHHRGGRIVATESHLAG
ncbi:NUDIX domain-containing protein [Nocardioides sp. AE5]|uniref:NUDIX hydrolase n=1 Tax=Nocardioides sp. AE5 TaxID=2962573 RepID=UPI002881AA2F|nr:NUDIX domain-containing protein [Nocardioides sp. AE5]MDT0202546.1 NUDIX domain-containing protein [Nocardioides sp. AE5]